MCTRAHSKWSELRLLAVVFLVTLFSRPALSVNQLATDDMVVELLTASIPPESAGAFNTAVTLAKPHFFIRNLAHRYVLRNVQKTEGGYRLRVDGRVPAGSYRIFARTKGAKPIVVGYNFQVHSPSIHDVEIPGIYEGATINVRGFYFGKSPEVYLEYTDQQSNRVVVQRCFVLDTSFAYDDPYDFTATRFPMDVDSGISRMEIQLPRLESNQPANLRLTIKNDSGYAVALLQNFSDGALGREDAPQRGQYTGYEVRERSLPHDAVRGYLIDSISDKWLYQQAVKILLAQSKMDKMNYVQDLRLYTVSYSTVDAQNKIVPASGVVIVPKVTRPGQTTSLLSYQHGTMLNKLEAPSISRGGELGLAVTLAAAEGYVVAVPDHLGLGTAARTRNDLIHPYCQWEPNARTDGDMLRAIASMFNDRDFLRKEGAVPALDGRVLLTGYSEGGYLTLGLHRELEANLKTYGVKGVIASAPMAGPYSLSDVMRRTIIADAPYREPFFAPYTLVTMNNTYAMYKQPSEYLKAPYDKTLPDMIDGQHSADEVNKAMPDRIWKILTESVYTELRLADLKGPLMTKLVINDLSAPTQVYTINSPVLLVHGDVDELVPLENAELAWTYLHNNKGKKNIETRYLPTTWWMRRFHDVADMEYHELYATFAVGESWEWLRSKYNGQ